MTEQTSGIQFYPIGSPEGLAEARRLIAEAWRTEAEELDIGGLGLVEVPEELFELGQLKLLYLGLPKIATEKPDWKRTQKDKNTCNAVRTLPPAIFTSLLHLSELHLEYNRLTELPDTIARLTGLTTLDLGSNKIGADQTADFGSAQSSVDVKICQLSAVIGRDYAAATSI